MAEEKNQEKEEENQQKERQKSQEQEKKQQQLKLVWNWEADSCCEKENEKEKDDNCQVRNEENSWRGSLILTSLHKITPMQQRQATKRDEKEKLVAPTRFNSTAEERREKTREESRLGGLEDLDSAAGCFLELFCCSSVVYC